MFSINCLQLSRMFAIVVCNNEDNERMNSQEFSVRLQTSLPNNSKRSWFLEDVAQTKLQRSNKNPTKRS